GPASTVAQAGPQVVPLSEDPHNCPSADPAYTVSPLAATAVMLVLSAWEADCFSSVSRCASALSDTRHAAFSPGAHSNSGVPFMANAIRTPRVPPGMPKILRTGRLGSDVFRPDQVRPASVDRQTPAAFATVISSGLTGETAKSEMGDPRIDAPWYAVRLSQLSPPSSDRNAFRANAYKCVPLTRKRAPASGLFGAASLFETGGTTVVSGAGFQVSRSTLSKMRPLCARANNLAPSEEYQTRSTGPVAADGRPSSMALLPM